MKDLRTEEYFSSGFQLAKLNYGTILLNIIVYFFLALILTFTILGIFLLPALAVGFYKFLIRAARRENVDVGDSLSEGFKNGMWWKSLVFIILSTFGIIVGLMLLILPGIYLLVAWLLGFYLLIDKGMGPMQALGKSRELVHKLGFWKVFVIVLAIYILESILFAIPFGVFIWFFLLPFILMVYIALYENAISDYAEDREDAVFAPSEGV
tara:strand:+ start:82 stop:711 length:630 start_codon:yes stop_codon:yes gene_type:complete